MASGNLSGPNQLNYLNFMSMEVSLRFKLTIGIFLILLLPTVAGAQELRIISENNPLLDFVKQGSEMQLTNLEGAKKVGAIATYKNDVREQLLRSQGVTNLDSSKSPVSNLKKLMSGRVDLWLFSNLGIKRIASQIGVDLDELELVLPLKES